MSNTFRFLDDLVSINSDELLKEYHSEIYPKELEILETTKNRKLAEYLDIKITILDNFCANITVFDKRREFCFESVKYPNFDGLMTISQKKGVIFGQVMRCLRICNTLENFKNECSEIKKDMKKAKLSPFLTRTFIKKALVKYKDLTFQKFQGKL